MKTLLACSLLAVALFSQADGHFCADGNCGTYNMTITCDDYMTVYFDDEEKPCPDPVNGCDEWWTANTYQVPWNTRVITIRCLGAGGPTGVLAYFEDGTMTDASWYCAPTVNGECPYGHHWPAAVDHGAYGTPTGPLTNYGVVNGMPDSPHWIWTGDPGAPGDQDVCCRMYSRKPGFCSTVDVDDYMDIYFDGIQVLPEPPEFDMWDEASNICMPWYTHVIAIHGHNVNGPSGIVGTFANDVIMTDGTWQCSNQHPPDADWAQPWYVPGWPAAVDHGPYDPPNTPTMGRIPWGDVTGMTKTPGLDWIWTDKAGWLPPHQHDGDQDVYCRKDIRGAGYWMTVTCDDQLSVFFDGVKVPHMNSMNLWYDVTVIFVPWNTLVIGMECSNGGGPSGFLAHFSNGLITDGCWKCSGSDDFHDECEDGWAGPTFDDSGWSNAVDYGSQPGGRHSGVPYAVVADMPDDPHWIWDYAPGHHGHRHACCRIFLGCGCDQDCDCHCHHCHDHN